MPQQIQKAMVLCAGLGTRLRPITETIPKPIVPVLNLANVFHTFFILKKAGIREIIVNSFHLSKELETYLKSYTPRDFELTISKESILLGTGGGVKKAAAFFGKDPFILANCDFVTNIELAPYIERHFSRGALASMVLFQDPVREKIYSKVGVDESGNLCSLPRLETKLPAKTGIFTGIHILSPACLNYLEEKPSGINEVLYPTLMKENPKAIFGDFATDAYWYDTGDVGAFLHASQHLLEHLGDSSGLLKTLSFFGCHYKQVKKGIWLEKGESLPEAEIEPPVLIGKSCSVGRGVRLGPKSVIGDHATIGDNASVSTSVLLPHANVPLGGRVESSIYFGHTAIKK